MPVRTAQSALPGTCIFRVRNVSGQRENSCYQDWPIPKTVTEIRQFLGLASYYRRYIQQFAGIATPLHYLTETTATFVWTEECQKGFQRLKDLLSQAPVLCYPSLTKDFELQTDASAVGLGAVLEQDGHMQAEV